MRSMIVAEDKQDGPNLYAYCHNNPAALLDELGLKSIPGIFPVCTNGKLSFVGIEDEIQPVHGTLSNPLTAVEICANRAMNSFIGDMTDEDEAIYSCNGNQVIMDTIKARKRLDRLAKEDYTCRCTNGAGYEE